MTSHAEQDVYLDALALMTAHHRGDDEGFDAVLDAIGDCPWYLTDLVDALVVMAVGALRNRPAGSVEELLAEARQFVLERP